jgi:hypothetical protein
VALTPPASMTKDYVTALVPSGKPLTYGVRQLKNLVGFIEYPSLKKYLKNAETV